ncbi:hypothetical protein HJFPF1_03096 [Paramyrothecium foliicola]|nr:hypothetical protein HJFPF1_03096 [Paramyrothecium foliicola]
MARLMEQTTTLPPISDPTLPKFPVSESPFFARPSSAYTGKDNTRAKPSTSQIPFQTGAAPPSPSTPNTPQFPPLAGVNVDPKLYPYIARIAAYYQHRCEAIVGFQQQRCVAWANIQRQRYLEMMHGSKLVVAWYIRDRIQRKRRQQKRKFHTGLKERASKPKTTRRDAIARWVSQISDDSTPPDKAVTERCLDRDEIDFTINTAKPMDSESKMLQTVDTLIRSQTKKVELPMLGVLDLSESDHESDDTSDQDDDCSMDFDDTTGEDIYDFSDDEADQEIVTSAKKTSLPLQGEAQGAGKVEAASGG